MFNLEEASEVKPDFDSGKSPRLSVAGFYGDHAVFQHGKCTVVKGKATPQNKVFLTIGSVKLAVFANDFGEFAFKIPPMPVQSNLDMIISCGNESLKFTDIAFGNVYLASGQSNMQMKIKDSIPGIEAAEKSGFDKVRCFFIPVNTFCGKASATKGSWIPASEEVLNNFSATAGFFAASLAAQTGIPTGIIAATDGGVNIESFISEYSLRQMDVYRQEVEEYEAKVASIDLNAEKYPTSGKLFQAINELFPEKIDDGGIEAGFCEENFDDSSWESMLTPDSWTQAGHNHAGIFYFRKYITLPENLANSAFTLHLGAIDKADRTFVNGKEVGATGNMRDMQYWNTPRVYDVPAGVFHSGKNTIAIQVSSMLSVCADGGLIGPVEEMYLEDENHTIKIPLSGSWQLKETFDAGTIGMTCMRSFGQGGTNSFHSFFDNMIAPLEGTALAGVLWYQGEANAICMTHSYKEAMEALIYDWRRNFLDSKLNFYIIQLPEFQAVHRFAPHATWPRIREAQHLAAISTGSSTVVTLGTGDIVDIHPRNKKGLADKIVKAEIARLNGKAPIIPALLDIKKKNNSLLLKFNCCFTPVDHPRGVVIAGKDMVAFEAECTYYAPDTLQVSSGKVDDPFAVWYAWAENPRFHDLRTSDGEELPQFRAALDNSVPVGKNLID